MLRDPRAFLWDVREAAHAIQAFTLGMQQQDYVGSELVQAAMERKFEIMGEALNQLARQAPELAARIPELAQVVAFRNRFATS